MATVAPALPSSFTSDAEGGAPRATQSKFLSTDQGIHTPAHKPGMTPWTSSARISFGHKVWKREPALEDTSSRRGSSAADSRVTPVSSIPRTEEHGHEIPEIQEGASSSLVEAEEAGGQLELVEIMDDNSPAFLKAEFRPCSRCGEENGTRSHPSDEHRSGPMKLLTPLASLAKAAGAATWQACEACQNLSALHMGFMCPLPSTAFGITVPHAPSATSDVAVGHPDDATCPSTTPKSAPSFRRSSFSHAFEKSHSLDRGVVH